MFGNWDRTAVITLWLHVYYTPVDYWKGREANKSSCVYLSCSSSKKLMHRVNVTSIYLTGTNWKYKYSVIGQELVKIIAAIITNSTDKWTEIGCNNGRDLHSIGLKRI